MQLFALLTDVKHASSNVGRAKVSEYLALQFNAEYVAKFLKRYDFYISQFHAKTGPQSDEQIIARRRENIRRLRCICADINIEIDLEEKVLLLSLMLNYIAKPDVSYDEERFVDALADLLRIPPDDFWNIKTFTLDTPADVVDKSRLLVINGRPEKVHPDVKHIYINKFGVSVWVLHVKCTNTFIFRYDGGRNLYLSGHKLDANKVYPMAPGGVINTSHVRPVYYGHIAEKFITRPDTGRIIYKAIDVEYKFSDSSIGIHKFSFLGKSGQLVGVMGGSGSGKSTLVKGLLGLKKPDKGEILFAEGLSHNDIGYLPQQSAMQKDFPASVFEVVLSGRLNSLKRRPFFAADSATPVDTRDLTIQRYTPETIAAFRDDDRFGDAYGFCESAPDMLGVAALRGGKILGMAGASADSPLMWQIGINVLPEARGQGVAAMLVSLLRNDVLAAGRLPYYGTSVSHLESQRVALRAGFLPAWFELVAATMG